MPRPRKYASNAERSRAYRMRKKLTDSPSAPELDALARAVHRIYKKRALQGIGHAEHLVGKTPFETLLRVVMYQVLYENHVPENSTYQFPGWEEMIRPVDISGENGTSYMVKNVKNPSGVMIYLPDEDSFFGMQAQDDQTGEE